MSASQDSQSGRRGYDLTFGIFNQTGPWTDRRRLAWENVVDLLTVHGIGRKEGTCVVPAIFSGESRKKDEARKIDIVFLDSDTGHTLNEIETAIRSMGWSAVISSSHSHMTTRTKAKKTNWDKFCTAQKGDIDADSLAFGFLHEEKGYLAQVAEGAFLSDPKPGELKSSEEGQYVFFEHSPCPKFRVAIPLARPWKASDFPSQVEANAVWKGCIEALASALRLGHDQACTDTSRLFYLPRRLAAGPMPETAVLEGSNCDIFALERPTEGLFGAAAAAREKRRQADEMPEYVDPDGVVRDLTAWARSNGLRFEIVKALRARKPEIFVGHLADGVKHHIRCPNEGEHTNGGVDVATFVTNASEANNKGFVFHCRHGHCDGRDRLFFLRKMLEENWLSIEDLSNPEFLRQTEGASGANGSEQESPPASTRGRRREAPAEKEWPEPIDFLASDEMTGAPELQAKHVPEALQGFVFDVAERIGVDPAAVLLTALVSCATVISEDWKMQPKRNDDEWTEEARLWGAIVGDPSIAKSPIIAACTRPIQKLERDARLRHAEDVRRYKADHKKWKDDKGEVCDEPRVPRQDRYLIEGATVEAISEALRDDPEAKQRAPSGKVLVRQDEMSEWLASFDRYRSGGSGGADRGAYLRLYNGGYASIDRIGRGNFGVPNWSACFIGGIQPGPIQQVAQNSKDDGLLQRFMFCVPARQDEGVDRQPNYAARGRYEDLIAALSALRPATGGNAGLARPVVFHGDAHKHRDAVNDLWRAMSGLPDTSKRMQAAYGKWPGLFARLVLTFHLIRVADLQSRTGDAPPTTVVPEDIAAQVAAYMEEIVLPHLLRADALMFQSTQTNHARWIAGFILAKGKSRIAVRDVVANYRELRAPEALKELHASMEGLVSMGWLQAEEPSNPSRQPTAWTVNPMVLARLAERGAQERDRRKRAQEEVAELIRRQPSRGRA